MSAPAPSQSGFEFSASHNRVIGDLANKMSLVGFVIVLFGVLQMVNGVTAFFISRNPDRVISAAKEAGVATEQVDQLREAMTGGSWLSPFAISTLAVALTGLMLLVVGLWTRQAAGGFSAIVRTQGQDIARLMDALEALRKKYGLMSTLILIAALLSLISFGLSLWMAWKG